jgi:hypothetical protein
MTASLQVVGHHCLKIGFNSSFRLAFNKNKDFGTHPQYKEST